MTDQTLDKVSYRTWFNPDGSIPPFGSGEEDNVKLLYKDTGLLIQHNVFHKSFVGITDFLAAGQEIIFRIALNGTTGGHTHTYEKCEMLIERLD